jgi:hypothetical protein
VGVIVRLGVSVVVGVTVGVHDGDGEVVNVNVIVGVQVGENDSVGELSV